MGPYRQPGVPIGQTEPRATLFAVVDLAWSHCRARHAALVGDKPSRWRVFAHARWKERVLEHAFMVPTRVDLVTAAHELGATHLMVTLMNSYARVHGHPYGGSR